MPVGERRLVDFFLVGAAKAGTTSLYKILDSHPQVFMSEPKEPNFFTSEDLRQHGYLSRVRSVSSLADYDRLFAMAAPGQVLGEASVSYLAYRGTARKIFNYNPAARIIISLRDPVMRALSHHAMDQRLGYCRHSLEEIFRSPADYPVHFFQYFDNGLYFSRVREYMEIFPASHIHVIMFPLLASNQQMCATQLLSFLGVDQTYLPVAAVKENAHRVPKNRFYRFLYQNESFRVWIKRVLSPKFLDRVQNSIFSAAEKTPVDELLLQDMYGFFAADSCKLERLLGPVALQLQEKPYDFTDQ
jgi:hypothetical protein